ncbi:hypothetical protein COY27_01345 [Candidatus Woesearchaeota archaeon CG_4_10_14_0_2_um_filter_33_13]|nr:MAG: hypothetical protein COY27_01345 [Candidatus Woesearchaeota archaeon CG_4_10_14_0_2_um_filter_33_13]
MEKITKLLGLRKKIKKSKPTFVIKESKFSARIEKKWRFPRGRHSGSRQYHRGKSILPTTGYGSPKAVRGLHSSGKEVVQIANPTDLLKLVPSKQIAHVAKVGKKNMLEILKVAQEKKISLTNVKDVNQSIEKINSAYVARKKVKEEKMKDKSKKDAEKRKKAEEKKKKEEEKTEKKNSDNQESGSHKEEKEEQKKSIEKELIKKQ